jgi:hypothetical protein
MFASEASSFQIMMVCKVAIVAESHVSVISTITDRTTDIDAFSQVKPMHTQVRHSLNN